jgi:uncharacterized lipoprotein YajG
MKTFRLFLALAPLFLLCSCASTERKVIATKHTTLHQQIVVAVGFLRCMAVKVADTRRLTTPKVKMAGIRG